MGDWHPPPDKAGLPRSRVRRCPHLLPRELRIELYYEVGGLRRQGLSY
ncbi:MAG: hypothetical protein QXM16_00885 [Nitrososphaerota archaeon]